MVAQGGHKGRPYIPEGTDLDLFIWQISKAFIRKSYLTTAGGRVIVIL